MFPIPLPCPSFFILNGVHSHVDTVALARLKFAMCGRPNSSHPVVPRQPDSSADPTEAALKLVLQQLNTDNRTGPFRIDSTMLNFFTRTIRSSRKAI